MRNFIQSTIILLVLSLTLAMVPGKPVFADIIEEKSTEISLAASVSSSGVTSPTFGAGWSVIAIKTDGSVWVQSRYLDSAPKRISDISNAKEVTVSTSDFGRENYYILKTDNTLWGCSGDEGTVTSNLEKIRDNIIHFTASSGRVAAIDINNNLWITKYSSYGELDYYNVMSDVADVTNDGKFALKTDGTVWEVDRNLKIMDDIVKIDSTYTTDSGLYALKPDGSLWVWGASNLNYQNAGTPVTDEIIFDPDGESETIIMYYNFATPYCFVQNIDFMSASSGKVFVKDKDNNTWMLNNTWIGEEEKWEVKKQQIDIGSDIVYLSFADGPFGGNAYAVFMKTDGSLWAFGDEADDYSWPFLRSTPTKVMDGVKMMHDGGNEPIATPLPSQQQPLHQQK